MDCRCMKNWVELREYYNKACRGGRMVFIGGGGRYEKL